MIELKGLRTGIGSMPQEDADSALDLIFRHMPEIPFWPQLPKRDIREGMIAQFSEGLPCLKLTQNGLEFSGQRQDKQLESFYERIIAKDIGSFKISEAFAAGLHGFYRRLEKTRPDDIRAIKCQVVGPFTFAGSIKDGKGNPLLHDPVLLQAMINGLAMKAAWQLTLFKKFGKPIVIFFDEPYLGCFGSGYTPITKEAVTSGLMELTIGLKTSRDILIGVHCCGNTDWSLLTDIATIDIISFDAFSFMERFTLYAEDIKRFLGRGGIICWGIVPTQEFSGNDTPEALVARLMEGVDALVKKGLDKEVVLQQLLISPACGLGSLELEPAVKICELLSQTAASLTKSLQK